MASLKFSRDDIKLTTTAVDLINKYLDQLGLIAFDIRNSWSLQLEQYLTGQILNNFNIRSIMSGGYNLSINTSNYTISSYGQGSYNIIYKMNDSVIVRESKPQDLYSAFIENLKTLVLYIYTTYYIGVKIMPDIYNFGFNYTTKNKFYCVMELCNKIDYSDVSIPKQIYTQLRRLTHAGISFKHGDLTMNNVLIDKSENIVFIDFGFSSFKINSSINFEPEDAIINYAVLYPAIKQDLSAQLNLLHDMITLMVSYTYTKHIGIMLKLSDDSLPELLFGENIKSYLCSFFKVETIQYEQALTTFLQHIYFTDSNSINLFRDYSNGLFSKHMIIEEKK